MKDKHYKVKGYRLNNKTIKDLHQLKTISGLSYNLFFQKLIENYEPKTKI